MGHPPDELDLYDPPGPSPEEPVTEVCTGAAASPGEPTHPLARGSRDAWLDELAATFPPWVRERYRLTSVLGRGGMGIVLEGRDLRLERGVAIKGLGRPGALPIGARERQEHEVRVTAQLAHPNILPVFDVWTDRQGGPWCAMLRVPGKIPTLARRLAEIEHLRAVDVRPLGELIPVFLQVARAVAYAHSQGYLHRDLKPENILLGSSGEALVADWGVAARTQDVRENAHEIVGTRGYSAPEQLGIDGTPRADERADVYALGTILFELIVGRRASAAPTVEPSAWDSSGASGESAARERARQDEQEHGVASLVIPHRVPRELATIIARATARDVANRYSTVTALARDLETYLSGGLLEGIEYTARERASKWIRAHPGRAGIVAAALVGLATLSVATVLLSIEGSRVRFESEAKTRALGRVQRELVRGWVELAHRQWWDANPGGARELLDRCPTSRRDWEWRYVKGLCDSSELTLRGHTGEIDALVYDASGRWLATASADGTARVWDARSGALCATIQGKGFSSVALSPDGRLLATADTEARVALHDIPSGRQIWSVVADPVLIRALCFSPDARRLAVATFGRSAALVLDVATGREVAPPLMHASSVRDVVFSPDNALIATAGDDRSACIWDARTGRRLQRLEGHADWVWSVAFSPDGARLASATRDAVHLWDVRTGRSLGVLTGPKAMVCDVYFGARTGSIVASGEDRIIRLWDATTLAPRWTIPGGMRFTHATALSPDGRHLAVILPDHTVAVFDARVPPEAVVLHPGSNPIRVAFAPGGKQLVAGTIDGDATVWDVATESCVHRLTGHVGRVNTVAYVPGSPLVATGDDGGFLRLFDATTGEAREARHVSDTRVLSLALSPDTREAAFIDWDVGHPAKLRVIDLASGRSIRHVDQAGPACYSPDGKRMALALGPGVVQIIERNTGRHFRNLTWSGGDVAALTFSPDSRHLAIACRDALGRVFDLGDDVSPGPTEPLTLRGHRAPLCDVTYSPDGARIATAAEDRLVKIWDAQYGDEVLTLAGHDDEVHGLAWSADGRRIASASEDRTIRVFETFEPGALHSSSHGE